MCSLYKTWQNLTDIDTYENIRLIQACIYYGYYKFFSKSKGEWPFIITYCCRVWLCYNVMTLKDIWLIPKDYTFMASNTIFIMLGIQDNYLQKTTLIRSALTPGSYKTSLDISPLPISLSLHCKQIKKVKRELDGQPSSFWARMHMFLIIKKLFLQSI